MAKRFFMSSVSALAMLAGSAALSAPVVFGFTGAVQTSTISQAGLYRVSVGGARGGDISGSPGTGYYNYYTGEYTPGPYYAPISSGPSTGALVAGSVYLAQGTTFSVLVGGDGRRGSYNVGVGGGGLSYFDIWGTTIDMVAGGGGGASMGEHQGSSYSYGYLTIDFSVVSGGDGLAGRAGGDTYFDGGRDGFGGRAGSRGGGGGARVFRDGLGSGPINLLEALRAA